MRLRTALACAVLASPPAGAQAATLTLRFTGLDARGTVMVALFSSESGFKGDRAAATAEARPRGGVATVTFPDLPAGTYAVKSFQDEDGNGRLSLGALGIPREPYAFSNNARGRFGPPGWRAAAFDLASGGARQTIRMD